MAGFLWCPRGNGASVYGGRLWRFAAFVGAICLVIFMIAAALDWAIYMESKH